MSSGTSKKLDRLFRLATSHHISVYNVSGLSQVQPRRLPLPLPGAQDWQITYFGNSESITNTGLEECPEAPGKVWSLNKKWEMRNDSGKKKCSMSHKGFLFCFVSFSFISGREAWLYHPLQQELTCLCPAGWSPASSFPMEGSSGGKIEDLSGDLQVSFHLRTLSLAGAEHIKKDYWGPQRLSKPSEIWWFK